MFIPEPDPDRGRCRLHLRPSVMMAPLKAISAIQRRAIVSGVTAEDIDQRLIGAGCKDLLKESCVLSA